MRIVAISDTHGYHDYYSLPEGDLFIHAGDFCNYGKMEEVVKFVNWVEKLPHKDKLCIPGNHDVYTQKAFNLAKNLFEERGIRFLVDSDCEIDGLSFWGSPWTPICGNWAWNRTGKQLKEVWDQIPFGTDVLLTHGPPYKMLDETFYGDRIGCRYLLERVKVVKPKLVFCGHCHECGGMQGGIGDTHIFNVAVNDKNTTGTIVDI
jgi:Icc-related predicted phosphoesterase